MSIIDPDKTFHENYHTLLIEARKISVKRDAGELTCDRCKRPQANHCRDGRCTVYATSLSFHSSELTRLSSILEALEHIEELLK